MNDGLCACGGACYVPGYSEAREYVESGIISFFTVHPEGLSLNAYAPRVEQYNLFMAADPQVRAIGHLALMQSSHDLAGK